MRIKVTRIDRWSLIILLAGLASAGCTHQAEQEIRLIASSRTYEPDIPIPAGFKLIDEASEDRSTGVARLYLRHLYRGNADRHAVRSFYREQMPLARWSKVSDGNIRGRVTMRFEKAAESCTVEISKAAKGMGGQVEIQVLVSQEQRSPSSGHTQLPRNTP